MNRLRRDGMARCRLYFLLAQAALGVYVPFINLHLEHELGLGGVQIGVLAAVSPLMALLVAPIWGAAADARGSRLKMLRWAVGGASVTVLVLWLPDAFLPMLLAMALFQVFQAAIIPLGDGVIAQAAAGKAIDYGRLRLWGSIGFALGGLLFGQLGDRFGSVIIFPVFAFLGLLALPVMWRMVPDEPPPPSGPGGRTGALLRNRPLVRFLVVAGLASVGITSGYFILYIYLRKLGASPGLMGAVSTIGALTEIPTMLLSGPLIRKRGAPFTFAAGMALFSAGFCLYATLRTPEPALCIQILLGCGMGLLWPAAVTYVAQQAPAERTATAQSLLNAVMYGVGPLLATQIAGAVFDAAGAELVLLAAAGALVAGIALFALLGLSARLRG